MKPSIPVPCSADWENMKIGLISRHCESCRKDVMDFTQMSRHEILQYLIENRSKDICAHTFPSQLDYRHEEMLVTIRSMEKKYKNTNLSFYLLTLATLSLMGCESEPIKHITDKSKKELKVSEPDYSLRGMVICEDPDPQETKAVKEKTIQVEGVVNGGIEMIAPPIDGEIMMIPDPPEPIIENAPRMIVEVMPEFKGGTDALMKYVQENLKYPEFEQKNRIEGTVYASFVIDQQGKVIQPKILRSVSGSKNFDAEVIRVINSMPDWKPGNEKGIAVPVLFNLPFKFRL